MAKKKNKKKKPPKITVATLATRQAAMTQQLAPILHDAAFLEGALQLANDLTNYLKGVEPVTRTHSGMPTVEEMERMRAESKAQRQAEAKAKKRKARRKPKTEEEPPGPHAPSE